MEKLESFEGDMKSLFFLKATLHSESILSTLGQVNGLWTILNSSQGCYDMTGHKQNGISQFS